MKVGIQLYSVRKMMKEHPIETISKVVESGYAFLEPANHHADIDDGVGFGIPADKLRTILDRSGAKIISCHVYPFVEEMFKRVIEYNQKVGNTTIVYPMEFFRDREEALRIAERCEKFGKIASDEGMSFLYHNHFHEFQVFEGETVLDTIMNNTDPKHVNMELDTFWAMRAGLDPVEVIKHFNNRIKMLHQKDMSNETETVLNLFEATGKETYIDMDEFRRVKCGDDFIEIGFGRMDIQKIINQANVLETVDYIILEQDETKLDEISSIRKSMEGFKRFSGLEWS